MPKLYSVKDKAVGFTEIFVAENNFDALRRFSDAVNNPNPTLLSEHPGDFSLFELGELNQDTGEIISKTAFIEEAVVLKKKAKKLS